VCWLRVVYKCTCSHTLPGFDLASRSILVAKERVWESGRWVVQLLLKAAAAELCMRHKGSPAEAEVQQYAVDCCGAACNHNMEPPGSGSRSVGTMKAGCMRNPGLTSKRLRKLQCQFQVSPWHPSA
jgi:hypothetical protein